MRSPSRLLIAALLVMACAIASATESASAFTGGASPGAVKFVKRTDPSFDRFTEAPTQAFQAWMNQHFWRTEVFTPYFDKNTGWYHQGWVYKDLYALYKGSPYTTEHQSFILRDSAGNPLYIPWGCGGGTCPQYAADVGSPAYRQAWIAQAKAEVAQGYTGIWMDDVNLALRVGDGSGNQVAPIDPRTGSAMTERAWQEYVATFTEEIRKALPGVELLHNSIWYAGGAERFNNPSVKREIAAADYINLERGVNDGGLTGGSGEWSLRALLSFVDNAHAAGKGVVLDGWDNSPVAREYSLASYLLVSNGNDGLGLGAMTPENWWSAYEIDLGAAQAPRSEWQGLLRRDFTGGIALVNEPGAPSRTVTLPSPMYNTAGVVVSAITLGASSGAVLRYVSTPTPPPVEEPPATGGRFHANPIVVVLKERSVNRGALVILDGHVSTPQAGEVQMQLQRLVHNHWVDARRLSARVRRVGRFAAALQHLRHGHYRVRAVYLAAARIASAAAGRASSGPVGFAVGHVSGGRLARALLRAPA